MAKPFCACGQLYSNRLPSIAHAARVLQLEQVLDGPLGALEGRVALLPAQRLRQVVLHDLDVRRHGIGNARIGAAEHDVLAGRFEEVARDPERPGPVPPGDGLGVGRASLKSER